MNLNNHSDPQLIEQIDHLIETKQPSGIPVADDLATIIPQSRVSFQEHLEDRLIAQIQIRQNGQGDEELTALVITSDSTQNKKRIYVPLTLVAAILAVLVVGSVLLARGGKAPNTGLAVLLQETTTPPPTPIPLVKIIVAYQNLPRGYQFPSTADQIAKVIGYADWPEAAVPISALTEGQGSLEKLAGQILRTDVFREQPILSTLLVNDLSQIANVGSDMGVILPPERVAISLPLNLLSGATSDLQAGAQVNIAAGALFVNPDACPCSGDASEVMMQVVARHALVVHLGDFGTSPSTTKPDIITLAVLPDEAETLIRLVNTNIPMTLDETPAIAISPPVPAVISSPDAPPEPALAVVQASPVVITATPTAAIPAVVAAQAGVLAEGDAIAVTVPIDQITPQVGVGIQEGNHVIITAKYVFANVSAEGELQLVTRVPDTGVVTQPSNQQPQMISQVVINDAIVLKLDSASATITFGVLPQDVGVLRWALGHQVKLTIELQSAAATISTQSPVENVTIPAEDITTGNGIQLQAGNHASIATHFIVTNLADEFQSRAAADPSSITMDILVTPGPPISITPGQLSVMSPNHESLVVTQTITEDATVVSVSSDGITFAVTQQEAALLRWMLEAGMPVIVRLVRP
jgi:hypothetical protein